MVQPRAPRIGPRELSGPARPEPRAGAGYRRVRRATPRALHRDQVAGAVPGDRAAARRSPRAKRLARALARPRHRDVPVVQVPEPRLAAALRPPGPTLPAHGA